jgi:ferritin-like metal-binding protein YciE
MHDSVEASRGSQGQTASDQQLKQTFHLHMMEVGLQRERVDQILLELTSKVVAKRCAVTSALIATVETIIRETDRGSVRDAWLAASAHRIEEFEIASYQTTMQWALVLADGRINHLAISLGAVSSLLQIIT